VEGNCPSCLSKFQVRLIHSGFNDSNYTYCTVCGTTALCSHLSWPDSIPLEDFGPLSAASVSCLRPCICGGQFHTHAMPRCPRCRQALDPETVTAWIEAGSPGAEKGWRWQRSWQGLYAIVVAESVVSDPWSAVEQ
jgi:hypothetical protein